MVFLVPDSRILFFADNDAPTNFFGVSVEDADGRRGEAVRFCAPLTVSVLGCPGIGCLSLWYGWGLLLLELLSFNFKGLLAEIVPWTVCDVAGWEPPRDGEGSRFTEGGGY